MRRVKVKHLPRSVLNLIQVSSPHTGPGEARSGNFPAGLLEKKNSTGFFKKNFEQNFVEKISSDPCNNIYSQSTHEKNPPLPQHTYPPPISISPFSHKATQRHLRFLTLKQAHPNTIIDE
jgi:hypothetical protein